MLAVAVIVFREVLEAALIIGIVLAAAVGVRRRGAYVAAGIAGGLLGAALVAGFAAAIADAFAGAGQELLTSAVLLLAVGMLGWHNIWMARHGREMARAARELGQAVVTGSRPLAALSVVTGAAVLREGSETVLFVYGIAASGHVGVGAMLGGAALGLAAGAVAGAVLYRGLLRIPLKHLFAVTSWLVLLLAAGLAAQAAGLLVQADLIPSFGDQIWNTSFLLSEDSIPGRVLHTLVGYVARPAGVQLLAYAATLLAIGVPMWAMARAERRRRAALAVALTLAGGGFLAAAPPARADLHVRWPAVDYREVEFEHNGLLSFGRRGSAFDRAQSYSDAVGVGVLPFWMVELEGEMQAAPGQNLKLDAMTMENTFQLTPTGEYAFNLGFYAEYSAATPHGQAGSVTFGPIVQRELSDFHGTDSVHTLNLFLTHDVGPDGSAATGLAYAWQSMLYVDPRLSPAIEIYGAIPDLAHAGSFARQEVLAGPVVVGAVSLAPWGTLKYQVGYLFGLTSASPRGAVRWQLEYEVPF